MVMGSVEVVDMINGRREPSAFQPDNKVGKEIDAFVRQAFDRAQLVIKDRMPKKILHLSQLLQVGRGRSGGGCAYGVARCYRCG